jgi:hypothetical protein
MLAITAGHILVAGLANLLPRLNFAVSCNLYAACANDVLICHPALLAGVFTVRPEQNLAINDFHM